MANSKFQYVREFERENWLLPETYVVVRVDGRGFHQFSRFYDFAKPNDAEALGCMTTAAQGVMRNVQDILVAYGDSDEFSFVFSRGTKLFERREAKLVSTVVSTFTACYIHAWPTVAASKRPLVASHLPTFDGRAVVYPNRQVLRDYLSWRQADCHINNLYNTTFWALVDRGGYTPNDAETRLRGTLASDKNEILWAEYNTNYNNEPEEYRKGTILCWSSGPSPTNTTLTQRQQERRQKRNHLQVLHMDIIKNNAFWEELFAREDAE